jgi:hypothetical protein
MKKMFDLIKRLFKPSEEDKKIRTLNNIATKARELEELLYDLSVEDREAICESYPITRITQIIWDRAKAAINLTKHAKERQEQFNKPDAPIIKASIKPW